MSRTGGYAGAPVYTYIFITMVRYMVWERPFNYLQNRSKKNWLPGACLVVACIGFLPAPGGAQYYICGTCACPPYGSPIVCAYTSFPDQPNCQANIPNATCLGYLSDGTQVSCTFGGGYCTTAPGSFGSPTFDVPGGGGSGSSLGGNGITTGAGGLSNDFGSTRLTGPELGLPAFTSHATTANKQWLEEAMRRQTAIGSLRDTPVPKTTLDYERNYLKKTNPKAPCAGVSGPCIGSLDAKPDLGLLGKKETSGKNSPGKNLPQSGSQGIKKRKEMDPFEIERWSYERSQAGIRFQEAREEFDRKRAVEKADSLSEKALNYLGGEYYRIGRAKAEKFIQDKLPGVGALIGRIKTAEKGTAIAAAFTGGLLQDAQDAAMAGARSDYQTVDDISAKQAREGDELKKGTDKLVTGQYGGSGVATYTSEIKSKFKSEVVDKGAVQAVWGEAAGKATPLKAFENYMAGKK